MTIQKKITTEVAIDWSVELITRVVPGLLELIGGGPEGPGGPALQAIAKGATPAQKQNVVAAAKHLAEFAVRVQKVFAQQ
jgi:hypothetical protein